MSYQKKRPIRDRLNPNFTLSKGARGCNKPSTESRAEKLARKAAMRDQFHAAAQDHDRVTAILAGTHYTRERRLWDGRVIAPRKVDRHQYLPHQSDREMARHLRRAGAAQ